MSPIPVRRPRPGPRHGGGLVRSDDGTLLHVEVDAIDAIDATAGLRGLFEACGLPEQNLTTVVFTHGVAVSSEVWAGQRTALRGTARMVVWDQRGHGRSERRHLDHPSVEQTGADLEAVIEATTGPHAPLVLVGHSMGGMSVLALAMRRPDLFRGRVRGIVLISSSAGDLACEGILGLTVSALRRARLLPLVLASMHYTASAVGWALWRDNPMTRWLIRNVLFSRAGAPPAALAQARSLLLQSSWPVVTAFLPGFLDYNATSGLKTLHAIPVVAIAATNDRLTPVGHSQRIVDAIGSSAELVELPTAGHAANLVYGDRLSSVLLRVLQARHPKA